MTYAIKDTLSTSYYAGSATMIGYYHPDIARARFYSDRAMAQRCIDAGGHHVMYPGGRKLEIVKVQIKEIPSEYPG